MLIASLRKTSGSSPEHHDTRSGTDPFARAKAARHDLVQELLDSLAKAVAVDDKQLVHQVVQQLTREGDGAVPQVSECLVRRKGWNLDMALMRVLSGVKSADGVAALEHFYTSLSPSDVAYKIECARALGRCGGSVSREAILRIYGSETDEKLRVELTKVLTSVGVRPEELARLPSQATKAQLASAIEEQSRIRKLTEEIEKTDPKTEAGLGTLRAAITPANTLSVALAAIRRIENRSDDVAARTLLEIVRRDASGSEAKLIQTNALAALVRLPSNVAREAVGQLLVDKELALRVQAISLVGAYGTAVYLPALEKAASETEPPSVKAVATQAVAAMKTRIRTLESGNR